MICYKDRRFCPHWLQCKDGFVCDIALTPKVQEAADKWWEGFNHPNIDTPIDKYSEYPKCMKR